jgi:N-acetylneuraminate synthase
MNKIRIKNRMIGDGELPVVIAEIGINHEGNIDVAIEMADKAIGAGAEIIKHQTHIIEDEMSIEAISIKPANADVSIYDVMSRCALSETDERMLMNYVTQRNAIFISTPFSRAAVDRLVRFDIPAFKIGSGECTNYPLIKYIAKFRKPVILSTGMNDIKSIAVSVEILRSQKVPFALLHCTNVYPTPENLVRLNAMTELKVAFPDAVIGLSDHTTSIYPCLGAVALGASILERHFTDSKKRVGPDIECSMDPGELSSLIIGSKLIHQSLGGGKSAVPEELPTIAFAFASVVAIKNIEAGEKLTEDNIWVKRPGGGDFSASDFENLLGRTALRPICSGTQVKCVDIK